MGLSRPPQKPVITTKMPGTPFEPAQVYLSFYDLCRQRGSFHISRAYAQAFERFTMQPHQHDRAEFIYIESGKIRLKLYHLSGRRIEFHPDSRPIYERVLQEGDIVFMDAGVYHELELVSEEQDTTIYNMELAPADSRFWDAPESLTPSGIDSFSLRPLMDHSPAFQGFVNRGEPYVRRSQAKELEGLFHALIRTFKDISAGEAGATASKREMTAHDRVHQARNQNQQMILRKTKVDELQARRKEQNLLRKSLLSAFLINYAKLTEDVEDSAGYPHIETIREFIEENYAGEMSLELIAKQVNLHPTYVQRIFHLHTGKTVMSYVNDLRLDKACLLLENTSIQVSEIASLCGFNSRQAFSTAFNKRENKSPRVYRTERKRKEA